MYHMRAARFHREFIERRAIAAGLRNEIVRNR